MQAVTLLALPVDPLLVRLTGLPDYLLLIVAGLDVGQATLVLDLEVVAARVDAARQAAIECSVSIHLLVHQVDHEGPLDGLLILFGVHDEGLAIRQKHDSLRRELTLVFDPLDLRLLLIGVELAR